MLFSLHIMEDIMKIRRRIYKDIKQYNLKRIKSHISELHSLGRFKDARDVEARLELFLKRKDAEFVMKMECIRKEALPMCGSMVIRDYNREIIPFLPFYDINNTDNDQAHITYKDLQSFKE